MRQGAVHPLAENAKGHIPKPHILAGGARNFAWGMSESRRSLRLRSGRRFAAPEERLMSVMVC